MIKRKDVTEEKHLFVLTIICLGDKFRHILKSSEKVFYAGDTKFSYTGCQWIDGEAVK